jgi:hypothetical protein
MLDDRARFDDAELAFDLERPPRERDRYGPVPPDLEVAPAGRRRWRRRAQPARMTVHVELLEAGAEVGRVSLIHSDSDRASCHFWVRSTFGNCHHSSYADVFAGIQKRNSYLIACAASVI